MVNYWIIGLLCIYLVLSILAAELRNIKRATISVALQSLFLVAAICIIASINHNPSLYWWAVTAFLIKVTFIPAIIWKYSQNMPEKEVKPILGFIPSIVSMVIILLITYFLTDTYLYPYFEKSVPQVYQGIIRTAGINLSLGITTLVLGIFILLTKRDFIKVVIGLVVLENGVNQVLVSLVPSLAETAEFGIACNLLISCWFILFLAKQIYIQSKTKDSTSLSELKW